MSLPVSVRPRPSHCENVYSLPPCSQPLSFACLPRDCAASSCGGTNLSPKTALMARVRVGIGVGTAPAPASAAAVAPNATADQAAAASVAPPSNPAVRADAFAVPALRRGASGVVCSASPASATSGASSSGVPSPTRPPASKYAGHGTETGIECARAREAGDMPQPPDASAPSLGGESARRVGTPPDTFSSSPLAPSAPPPSPSLEPSPSSPALTLCGVAGARPPSTPSASNMSSMSSSSAISAITL
mmetsp:Transcript_14909/g.62050  ORF Transcript_14909/g.62050 Transcript_14909/m.62050 type:complete len:247 (-) Transcript_14909:105-845(-)